MPLTTQDTGPVKNPKLHLKDWKRKLAWRDSSFACDGETHPHRLRRMAILDAHPEIRTLFRKDPWMVPIILTAVGSQVLLAFHLRNGSGFLSMLWLMLCACAIGGTLLSFLAIALHECTHGLVFESSLANKLLALTCNIGNPIPIAMGFRRYHSDHHAFQGSAEKDPDMPLNWELALIHGNPVVKSIWLFTYPILYAVRAMVRGKTMTFWEAANFVFTIATNILFWKAFGWRSWLYTMISFLYGYTYHPVAAHFLQEHYTFLDGQETYNYYGWANSYFINMGFHNEHHDFPGIPGRFLPLVTRTAPEFYFPLQCHKSWRSVLKAFIFDSNIGPQSRCSRLE